MNITEPSLVHEGDNLTLSCDASSNPPSHYKWFFNGSVVANTSEYFISHLSINMTGEYICSAYNNITGQNRDARTLLLVLGETWMAVYFIFL